MIVVANDAYAKTAAGKILDVADAAVSAHGAFHVALAGGSTPKAIYRRLVAAEHDFRYWHVYFGDERWVPREHPDSNYRMAREALLDHVPIPAAQIHAVPTDTGDPQGAAKLYEATLHLALPAENGAQRLDLILLGLGSDGHTASLFPGSTALDERKRWVVANWVEKLASQRITLTYPAIARARQLFFLVTGVGKRDILAQVRTAMGTDAFPAAKFSAQQVEWIVDQAAAGDPCGVTG